MVKAPTGKFKVAEKQNKNKKTKQKQTHETLNEPWLPLLLAIYTLPGAPLMPREFLKKRIISAACTATILLLRLHPLRHLSPSVPFTGQHQIFIASSFLNKSRHLSLADPSNPLRVCCVYRREGTDEGFSFAMIPPPGPLTFLPTPLPKSFPW